MDNKETRKNKINVFTAFSGYDSQCMALERLKEHFPEFDYELVGWSEIDEPAIRTHNAVFPEYADRNYGDISKIDWKEVPDFDLFTYSSPCFVPGTLITVKDSIYDEGAYKKKIEEIQVGQLVLTHDGTYKRVTEVMSRKYKGKMYSLVNTYYDEVRCTPDHPFYCSLKDNDEDFTWVPAKDIDIEKHYVKVGYRRKYDGEYDLIDCRFAEMGIYMTDEEIEVYNLEVEDNHSYVANDFVVHNCQDFSICGKQRGGVEGSGTRSSLLWECKKTIENKRPKFCLLENVKALVSEKFINLFNAWVRTVNAMGYRSYYKVLNSADFNVPQGRERVFLVSVRIDNDDPKTAEFNWPSALKRTKEIEDVFIAPEDKQSDDYYMYDDTFIKTFDLIEHTGEDFKNKTVAHKDIASDWDEQRTVTNEENEQKLKAKIKEGVPDASNLFDYIAEEDKIENDETTVGI